MEDITLETQREIVEFLRSKDVKVTAYETKEYVSGNPTIKDREVTGAEIKITCFLQLAEGDDEDSRFKVK